MKTKENKSIWKFFLLSTVFFNINKYFFCLASQMPFYKYCKYIKKLLQLLQSKLDFTIYGGINV